MVYRDQDGLERRISLRGENYTRGKGVNQTDEVRGMGIPTDSRNGYLGGLLLWPCNQQPTNTNSRRRNSSRSEGRRGEKKREKRRTIYASMLPYYLEYGAHTVKDGAQTAIRPV